MMILPPQAAHSVPTLASSTLIVQQHAILLFELTHLCEYFVHLAAIQVDTGSRPMPYANQRSKGVAMMSESDAAATYNPGDLTTSGYSTKSFVQCSESLLDFNGEPIAEFSAHAPNVIQNEDGSWFISSTDYPHRGISAAPLEWK